MTHCRGIIGKKGDSTLQLFVERHRPHYDQTENERGPMEVKNNGKGVKRDGRVVLLWYLGCSCGDGWHGETPDDWNLVPVGHLGEIYGLLH